MKRTTEIAVVGGGPAGLQAALSAGRVHREAVLLDSGEYRNAPVEHMHNVAAADGVPPASFRATAREQLAAYPTVQTLTEQVTTIRPTGADDAPRFELDLADGSTLEARAVVLATGLRDQLPDIPGLDEVWGTLAAQCPFCHGHEFADRTVAVLGAEVAPHLGFWLHRIARQVVVLDDGTEASADTLDALAGLGATVAHGKVTRVARSGDGLAISLATGEEVQVAGLFLMPGLVQRAPFAHDLGLELNPSGCVRIDPFGHTSVPGVYAAGDMAHLPELPMPVASVIQSLAAGQTAVSTAMRECR